MMARDNNDLETLTVDFCGDGTKKESITRACYNLEILKHGLPKKSYGENIKYPYFFAPELFT